VSWSGALATNYALTFPDRVAGLVAARSGLTSVAGRHRLELSPGVDAGVGTAVVRTALMPLAYPMMDRLVRAAFAPQAMPDGYPARAALALALRPTEFLANARDVADLKANVTLQAHRYGEIRVPAVISRAIRDTTVSPDIHSRRSLPRFRTPKLIICRASGIIVHHAKAELVIGEIDAIAANSTASPRLPAPIRQMRYAPCWFAPGVRSGTPATMRMRWQKPLCGQRTLTPRS